MADLGQHSVCICLWGNSPEASQLGEVDFEDQEAT